MRRAAIQEAKAVVNASNAEVLARKEKKGGHLWKGSRPRPPPSQGKYEVQRRNGLATATSSKAETDRTRNARNGIEFAEADALDEKLRLLSESMAKGIVPPRSKKSPPRDRPEDVRVMYDPLARANIVITKHRHRREPDFANHMKFGRQLNPWPAPHALHRHVSVDKSKTAVVDRPHNPHRGDGSSERFTKPWIHRVKDNPNYTAPWENRQQHGP